MTAIVESIAPSRREVELAKESSRLLQPLTGRKKARLRVQIDVAGRPSEAVDLPPTAVSLLLTILSEMSQGNAVTLQPVPVLLTTQQAADFLFVSRPFLIKELESGKLPFHKVGTHRRVHYRDLLAYKQHLSIVHDAAMDELVEQAQKLGMGY